MTTAVKLTIAVQTPDAQAERQALSAALTAALRAGCEQLPTYRRYQALRAELVRTQREANDALDAAEKSRRARANFLEAVGTDNAGEASQLVQLNADLAAADLAAAAAVEVRDQLVTVAVELHPRLLGEMHPLAERCLSEAARAAERRASEARQTLQSLPAVLDAARQVATAELQQREVQHRAMTGYGMQAVIAQLVGPIPTPKGL